MLPLTQSAGAIVPVITPAFCPTMETSFPPESPMAPLADAALPFTTTRLLEVRRAAWTVFIEHSGAVLVAAPVSEHPALFTT